MQAFSFGKGSPDLKTDREEILAGLPAAEAALEFGDQLVAAALDLILDVVDLPSGTPFPLLCAEDLLLEAVLVLKGLGEAGFVAKRSNFGLHTTRQKSAA